MNNLYDYPEYYDLSFSFRNCDQEVTFLENLFEKYGNGNLKHFLEICSGNSPHLGEILRRGYNYTGIELNQHMIDYVSNNHKKNTDSFKIIKANMNNFETIVKADFAYVMLGSFFSITDEEINNHFKSVYNSLEVGGLYFLDWVVRFKWDRWNDETWTHSKDNITLNFSHSSIDRNYKDQIYTEYLKIDVDDNGKKLTLEDNLKRRVFFPKEFNLLQDKLGFFEIVGMWNNFDINQPIDNTFTEFSRPSILLRKK